MLGEVKTTIASVKGLIDLLSRLIGAQQSRRQARFNELIRPLHDKFQEVQLDYSTIMRNLSNGLPRKTDDQESILGDIFQGSNLELMTPKQAKRAIKVQISRYQKDRQQQEAVRDMLRHQAGEILRALKDKRERRYVYSIISYFHEHSHRDFRNLDHMDSDIERIIAIGGDRFLETPSRKLLNEIRDQEDPDFIQQRVTYSIYELNQRFSDVAKTYTELLCNVIDNKT